MLDAPCAGGCSTWGWCCLQFWPCTCCCAQYFLRKRVLENDMSKYVCCQGYINICQFRAGSCGEQQCPSFCLCVESCLCNGCAVSASRMVVMDRYQLSSDPCDYRLIRINNCLQVLSCICDIAAIFDRNLQHVANLIDWISDVFYHSISGCMTAQVVHELNHRQAQYLIPDAEIEPFVASVVGVEDYDKFYDCYDELPKSYHNQEACGYDQ
jgi:hypothetical protein